MAHRAAEDAAEVGEANPGRQDRADALVISGRLRQGDAVRLVGIQPGKPAVERLRALQHGGLDAVVLKPELVVEQELHGITRSGPNVWQFASTE